MRITLGHKCAGLAILSLFLCNSLAVRADLFLFQNRALLVGVNQYPHLNGANLNGCVPDAQRMEKALTAKGFKVTLLTDAEATRQGILTALQTPPPAHVHWNRFVFYFVGHGTRNKEGMAVVLPSDSREDSEVNDLDRDTLFEALKSVPAESRVAIFDCAFSNGLMPPAPQHQICYISATQKHEMAGEDEFADYGRGSTFTHALLKHLEEWTDNPIAWQELLTKIQAEVGDEQHPQVAPGFETTHFGDKSVTPVTPPSARNPPPKPITFALNTGEFATARNVAVIIGINEYPGFKDYNLFGCVSDAELMAGALADYGFTTGTLLNAQATRQGIIDTLLKIAHSPTQHNRIVFYFAGGAQKDRVGNYYILPADVTADSEKAFISGKELYALLCGISAKSRTVILDTNYAEGSIPTYPQQNVGYYVACRKNQSAGEDVFPDGERHGIFTYYLADRLRNQRGWVVPWDSIMNSVSSSVADWMGDGQHPFASPDLRSTLLFEPIKFRRTTLPQIERDESRRVAVVVTIDQYANSASAEMAPDARQMTNYFRSRGYKVVTFANNNATRNTILNTLQQFAKLSPPLARFAYYYSGPSVRIDQHKSALLPSGARRDQIESLVSESDLTRALNSIRAQQRLVILDCPYAGGLLPRETLPNTYYLASSKADELAGKIETAEGMQGLFTQALLTHLAAHSDHTTLDWSRLLKHLRADVQNHLSIQNPQFLIGQSPYAP